MGRGMSEIKKRDVVKRIRKAGLIIERTPCSGDSRVRLPSGTIIVSHLCLRKTTVPAAAWMQLRKAARRYGIELPPVSKV